MTESLLDDLQLVARGFRWTRRRIPPEVARGALHTAPPLVPPDTAWARSPAVRAVRDLGLSMVLPPLLHSTLDIQVGGSDRLVQLRQPVVFVANHASHLDAPLVLNALPPTWRRRTVIAAASDYFFTSWWRSALAALAFNAVPLDRRSRDGAQHSLADLLAGGWNVLAFPEGTRSRDGRLQRLHLGAARLALDLGVPLVPVGVRGTFRAMQVGARWPRPGRTTVSVRFGPPVEPFAGERARDLTVRLRSALEAVLHEDATTWWSAMSRSQEGATTVAPATRWRSVWEATSPVQRRARPAIWRRP
jgi:1-acyl-sn-glycerol-3-phosphate acyltransferase